LYRHAIDAQLLVEIFDVIPRQADDALDVIDRRIGRVAEYHDLAALRVPHGDDDAVQ